LRWRKILHREMLWTRCSESNLTDSHGGAVALIDYANDRIARSMESRVNTLDALLHEWKSDLLRIWIPLITGVAMLLGLFGGMEIQGCRDAATTAPSAPIAAPAEPAVPTQAPTKSPGHPNQQKK
jgi:hypothetical protein